MIAALALVIVLGQAPVIDTPATETTMQRIIHEDPFPLNLTTAPTVHRVARKRLAQTGSSGGTAPVGGALLAAGGLAVLLGRSR